MSDLDKRITNIERRLAWLRQQDRAFTVFGASMHRYSAETPLDEGALETFESSHQVSLPASYRAYLREVSNGGGGPFYGLSASAPLELDRLPQHHVEISDGDGNKLAASGTGPREVPDVTSSLARPFPLTREWSPDQGALPVAPGTSPYDGCVHLSDQGCGYFDFLVVRGPAAGQVWTDYSAGGGPITRSHDDFLDWYEQWLDGAQLEWLEKNARDMALYAPPDYPGLEECQRLLDVALDRAPTWATAWRTRGYLAINRRQLDDALAAFEKAAEHGQDEPTARLHLDRARVATFRNEHDTTLNEVCQGLTQDDLWASTETELATLKVGALDKLGRAEDALLALKALADDADFDRRHHFDLAYRYMERDEPDRAWEILDDAVERNVTPDPHHNPCTRDVVYRDFAECLRAGEADELARRVLAQI